MTDVLHDNGFCVFCLQSYNLVDSFQEVPVATRYNTGNLIAGILVTYYETDPIVFGDGHISLTCS